METLNVVPLEESEKSLLTPKFVKSNSVSEWAVLASELKKAYEIFDVTELKNIAIKFAEGLNNDSILYSKNENISDCGLFAPRLGSTYNKSNSQLRFTNLIIELLYSSIKIEDARILYSQLVSKLSKKYIEQYTYTFLLTRKVKQYRVLEHNRKNWCALKNKPLEKQVTEPSAMPVEIAPLEELEPFFMFLNSDQKPIDNHFSNKDTCMLFNRGALYQDGRMDLCKQVVGPSWIENLMNSLVNNSHVEHFLLGNNIIGPIGGRAIGKFLLSEHKPKIKTWYLAGNDLDEFGIKWICDGLAQDQYCESLWLKRNPLKPEGIKHLAELFKTNTTIKVLDLHNTAVFDEGLMYLVEGLKENRTLKHLRLDANGITKHGVKHLVDYFNYLVDNNLEGITSLWINMNTIEDEGAIELVNALGKYKSLKRLDLGSCGLTEVSMQAIVNAFTYHPSLIVFDLGMYKSTSDMGLITNNIGDEGMRILSELIEKNTTLKYLSVTMNGLSKEGITLLAQAIDKNSSLIHIDFEQYGLNMPLDLYVQIKTKVEQNRENQNITTPIRYLKHSHKITTIDSIYRNTMK